MQKKLIKNMLKKV